MEEKIATNTYKLIKDANVYEKLLYVQSRLKAPKSQYNSFGRYNFRNAEDILEAVKPLCAEVGAVVLLSDKVIKIESRYYVETVARFVSICGDEISVCASAREEDDKKGMDGSQITGASSSYARKYALNGLFAIDDTKDSDTTNKGDDKQDKKEEKPKIKPTSQENKKVEQVSNEEESKPFKVEEPEPLTLEEARAMVYTSKSGEKYKVSELDNEHLLALKNYTKMPRLAEACALELAERARVEYEQGQNS